VGCFDRKTDYFGIGPALLSARTDAAKVTKESAARTDEVAITRTRDERRMEGSFSPGTEHEDRTIVGGSHG
jgi:hypothetical protein